MQSLKQIIESAEKQKIAIGHFNIAESEMLKAISQAAKELNLPVIIGASEGEREYLGVHHVADLIASYNKEHARENGYQLFLNADHTRSLKKIEEAAKAGYDAVLFDGGQLPFDENVEQTREAVKIAKEINPDILVEGELGYIGSGSIIRKEIPKGAAIRPEDLTKPEEAARFVKETGVDLLAPAVGNIHGMFADAPEPALDIARIRAIKEALRQAQGKPIPLVLHGASGNTDKELAEAIDAGIAVIHISTELRVAWRRGLEAGLHKKEDEIAPYKVVPEAIAEIEKVVYHKLKLFNKHGTNSSKT